MTGQRPRTLAEVAEWSSTWNELAYHLADFLHEFQARPAASMLQSCPRLLAPLFSGGEICDAYLAATAATLAARLGGSTPEWAVQPERYLRTPWFASPGAAMRACLLLESPARFRERNLFVTANALSVA
jgi:hypothetical protein